VSGATYDHAIKQIAADSSIGVGERIKQHNDLKTRHAKETSALKTEYAELKRIRENIIMMHGEDFYNQNSKRERGAAI
jgi:hypothetical protein